MGTKGKNALELSCDTKWLKSCCCSAQHTLALGINDAVCLLYRLLCSVTQQSMCWECAGPASKPWSQQYLLCLCLPYLPACLPACLCAVTPCIAAWKCP